MDGLNRRQLINGEKAKLRITRASSIHGHTMEIIVGKLHFTRDTARNVGWLDTTFFVYEREGQASSAGSS